MQIKPFKKMYEGPPTAGNQNTKVVSIFVHKSLKFTPLVVDEYCTDQDFEVCAIHPKSSHDKLCILAIYVKT